MRTPPHKTRALTGIAQPADGLVPGAATNLIGMEPAEVTAEPAPAPDVLEPAPTGARRPLLVSAALAVAGLVAGAIGTFVLGHSSSADAVENDDSTTQQVPADDLRGPGRGSFPGGPGAPGGFMPGGPGQQDQTQPGGVIEG